MPTKNQNGLRCILIIQNDQKAYEMAADFTVFDKDIMTIPEMEILDTKVEMTIVGGKVLYQAGK